MDKTTFKEFIKSNKDELKEYSDYHWASYHFTTEENSKKAVMINLSKDKPVFDKEKRAFIIDNNNGMVLICDYCEITDLEDSENLLVYLD